MSASLHQRAADDHVTFSTNIRTAPGVALAARRLCRQAGFEYISFTESLSKTRRLKLSGASCVAAQLETTQLYQCSTAPMLRERKKVPVKNEIKKKERKDFDSLFHPLRQFECFLSTKG